MLHRDFYLYLPCVPDCVCTVDEFMCVRAHSSHFWKKRCAVLYCEGESHSCRNTHLISHVCIFQDFSFTDMETTSHPPGSYLWPACTPLSPSHLCNPLFPQQHVAALPFVRTHWLSLVLLHIWKTGRSHWRQTLRCAAHYRSIVCVSKWVCFV